MTKMSLKIASLDERKSIYEIFRSCRLCGAGGGYRMPIIQNIVDLDTDVELSQKIKECVQIEVAIDDKMPPLICELCIEKVNDFYSFMTLCKNTDSKNRSKLGLPPLNQSSSPEEESILGVTEALCEPESDNEPIVSRASKPAKGKVHHKAKKAAVKPEREQSPPLKPSCRSSPPPTKTEPSKRESRPLKQRRESTRPLVHQASNGTHRGGRKLRNGGTKSRIRFESSSSLSPPPTRSTRTKTSEELFDELDLDSDSSVGGSRESSPMLVEKEKKPASKPGPKSKHAASLSPKGKLATSQQTKGTNKNLPSKKVKIEEEKPKVSRKRSLERDSHKQVAPAKRIKAAFKAKEAPPPPPPPPCSICAETFASAAARQSHARTHVVTFTELRLSCNACEDWFSTYEEAASHHKWHRDGHPYSCTVCTFDYDTLNEYNEHIEKYSCRKLYEEPDVQCLECWNDFPTETSLKEHHCLGEDGRPGGKCSKCGDMYALLKDLIDHESDCTEERRAIIDPMIRYKIKPTQILVARCDKLLERKVGLRYDVSNVPYDYGLDPKCYYPYFKKQIKVELTQTDGMVNITDDVRKQFEQYEDSDFLSNTKKSKTPKSNKKTNKTETAFDDLLNDDQPAFSQSYNFDSLIDSLDDKNNDSGEESVIKDFGFTENSSKNNDVIIKTDNSSPIKNSSFDIENLIKIDNDTEMKLEAEAMDIEVTDTVIGPVIDQSKEIPELSENGGTSIENNEKTKDSPTKHSLKLNDSIEKTLETNNLILKTEDSEEISQNNETINQSDNQSAKPIDKTIDSDTINIDSNGLSEKPDVSEKTDVSDTVKQETDNVSESINDTNSTVNANEKIDNSL